MKSKCPVVRPFRKNTNWLQRSSRGSWNGPGGRGGFQLHSMEPGKLHQPFQFLSRLHVPKDLAIPKESCKCAQANETLQSPERERSSGESISAHVAIGCWKHLVLSSVPWAPVRVVQLLQPCLPEDFCLKRHAEESEKSYRQLGLLRPHRGPCVMVSSLKMALERSSWKWKEVFHESQGKNTNRDPLFISELRNYSQIMVCMGGKDTWLAWKPPLKHGFTSTDYTHSVAAHISSDAWY